MAQTKLENIVDTTVMADMVSAKLAENIRFTPLATVNRDLVGRPGSVIAFPAWTYIGDAKDVAEGVAIDLDLMTASETPVEIKKAGKGVELTDEAVLSGVGDPLNEANLQLALSIAAKVDNDLLAAAKTGTQKTGIAFGGTVADLVTGLDIFADEDDEAIALIVNPADASALRIDAHENFLSGSEIGANNFINGVYGEVLGVQIIRSNKVEVGEAILVKEGALGLALKRDVQIEADRDIVKKTTVITADEHYAVYLYNDTKVVQYGAGE